MFVAFDVKDLSTDFVLSHVMEEKEKDFYKFEEEPDEGFSYVYDNEKLMYVDMEYLDGYADVNNNSLISVNHLAKLIFHGDIKKTEKIQPLTNEEIDYIVKKLVNHQVHMYKGLDKESYVFFHNLAKEEILNILTTETEEQALEIIQKSILFNEQEKKAAQNVYNQKDKYFSSHISLYIVEKALENNVKIGEYVNIREGIFDKRYKLTNIAVIEYINVLIDKASKLEKLVIMDPMNTTIKHLDEIDGIREKIENLLALDVENTLFDTKDKVKFVKYLYARAVLYQVLGEFRIEKMNLSFLDNVDEDKFDKYVFLGYLKMFIDNIDMNILTYSLNKYKVDKYIKAFAFNRILKIYQKVKDIPLEKAKILFKKKFGYKELTTKYIYDVGKKLYEKTKPICPKCNSRKVIKNGKSKKGIQRYKCKDCNKTFTKK